MKALLLLYGPLALTVTMWAFQAPALHALGERWDTATLNLVRYILAATAFGAMAAFATGRGQGAAGQAEKLAPANGLMLGGLFAAFALLFAGGAVIGNPVVSATASAVMPITASLVNWAVTGRPPEKALLRALLLVVPGAVLATPAPGEDGGGDRPVLGLALVLAAQVCWSLYSLAVPRLLPVATTIARSRISILWALPFQLGIFVLGWSLGFGHADPRYPAFDATVTLIAALGPLVLGLALWNLSVARLGLPVCALFLNLVPVLGTLIAWGFGTVPTLVQVAGVAFVILGMGTAQYSRRETNEGRSQLPRP